AVVVTKDLPGPPAYATTQDRCDGRCDRPPLVLIEWANRRWLKHRSGALAGELFGPGYQRDVPLVCLLGGIAPRNQAVVHKDNPLGVRVAPRRLGDLFRQLEPGPAVGHDGDVVPEHLVDHLLAGPGVGQGENRVRM